MDKNLRNLAEALARLIGDTTDGDKLNQLDRVAGILEPFFDPPLGHDIWLYAGLQRDANPEMASDYQKDILETLRLDPEVVAENNSHVPFSHDVNENKAPNLETAERGA